MLETRMPPISTRTRRSEAPAQSQQRTQPASRGSMALDHARVAPALTHTRPSARMNRLARSEMRLIGLATTCMAIVCGLLLLYLAAYAHVTQLGVAQSESRVRLRQAQTQNQMLRAERDRLESPQRILSAATAQGMIPRGTTTINYIHAPKAFVQIAQGQTGWDLGSSGGTTTDNSAASFDH